MFMVVFFVLFCFNLLQKQKGKSFVDDSVSHSVVSDSLRPHGLYVVCQAFPVCGIFQARTGVGWSGLPFPSPVEDDRITK